MKTRTKVLILALSAILLMAATVFATVAYLTSTDGVNNTFTVGNVHITMDEADVDEYGAPVSPAARVTENTYKLVPGRTYTKDPKIHLAAGSEDCYIFVKIESAVSVVSSSISTQMAANGWVQLTDGEDQPVAGVFYYTEASNAVISANADTVKDIPVFQSFAVDEFETYETLGGAGTKAVAVTAYAIQAYGFETPAEAWAGYAAQVAHDNP